MKEFEVQRKAEMERVRTAATEEEKKRIMVRFLEFNPDKLFSVYLRFLSENFDKYQLLQAEYFCLTQFLKAIIFRKNWR